MTYHQKAIVYTSDNNGQGKAVYWEDDNGKVTKKVKKIKSSDEIEKVYKDFGFNDPLLNSENFMNFSIPSPFNLLSGFVDNLFDKPQTYFLDETKQHLLPEGVDLGKHYKRLEELQEKKRLANLEKQRLEEEKRYLQKQIEELKIVKKELQDEGDTEGAKEAEKDMHKIEEKLKKI